MATVGVVLTLLRGETVRKFGEKMARFFVILLSLGVLFSSESMLWANPIGGDLEAKIAEFEKRLAELEKRNKELQVDRTGTEEPISVQVEELQRQLDILAEEVEKMRSVEQATELTQEDANKQGLGLSAAAVYSKSEGLSFAGYGEMV